MDYDYQFPTWSVELRGLYWRLRACRQWDSAAKRRWWRKIAVEKYRILNTGVPYIELHLITRVLAQPRNENAKARLTIYYAQGRLFG